MMPRFLPVILVSVFMSLSACDFQTSSEAESIASDNTPLDTINIGRLICGGHLPLAIVEKKFQGHQLKSFQLQTIQNHDWNDVVEDMKSGKLAGTFILSPLAMNLIHEGFPGKIVLTADRNGNGFVLSDKIKTIDQLKNQKSIIAVPHVYSQHNVLLHMLMQQHAIPVDNITIVGMPPRDMIGSLRRGEIDGFVVGEPEGNKSIGLGVGWMAAISPEIWKNHMDHVFLVTDRFIKEQPQQLQELITQLLHAGAFIEANPHEAAIMGEDYTGSPASVFEKVLTDPPDWIDYSDMTPRKMDIIMMAGKLIEMGLWNNTHVNPDQYLDQRFINRK